MTQLFGAEQPASAQAYITDSTVHAGRDLKLTADTSATISALVGNDATTAVTSFFGASALSATGTLSSNKIATLTQAYLQDTNAVDGAMTVYAAGAVSIVDPITQRSRPRLTWRLRRSGRTTSARGSSTAPSTRC